MIDRFNYNAYNIPEIRNLFAIEKATWNNEVEVYALENEGAVFLGFVRDLPEKIMIQQLQPISQTFDLIGFLEDSTMSSTHRTITENFSRNITRQNDQELNYCNAVKYARIIYPRSSLKR